MNTKPEAKSQARVLPPKFKHVIENDFMLRFTRMERIKILFGFNVELKYESPIEHSPGRQQPKLSARVVNKL